MEWRRHTEIRKLDSILDEENRDVISDQIPIAFVGIELGCESADIANGVVAAFAPLDRGETCKHRRVSARVRQDASSGDIFGTLV